MPTYRNYVDALARMPEDDPRKEQYRAILREVKQSGARPDDNATADFVARVRRIEAEAVAPAAGRGQSALLSLGRGRETMKQGMTQVMEQSGAIGEMTRAGIPAQLANDPRALESISVGAPYIYEVKDDARYPGSAAERQGPREATFKPTAEQASTVKRLTTLADKKAEARKQEREVYEAGTRNYPVQSALLEGVGAYATAPIPGLPGPVRTSAKVGAEAADTLARSAGLKTGAAMAAREAPAAAASGAIEYTEDGESRADKAMFAAALTGGLSVGSEAARGALYKLGTKKPLTPEERAILVEDIASSNAPAKVAASQQIPDDMIAALESAGVDVSDSGSAVEAIRGGIPKARMDELMATLSEDEVKSLTPAQAERLAVFRAFGYEPTPAQVMRDYRGMEDLAAAAQMDMDVAGNAVRQRMAEARRAPVTALERRREEAGGGLPAEGMPQAFRAGVKGTQEKMAADIGAKYKAASESAQASGTTVKPEAMLSAFDEVADQFNLGQAGQAAVMVGRWKEYLGRTIPQERRKAIIEEAKAAVGTDSVGSQALNAELFRRYAAEVGSIDPITLERMRKEVNSMAAVDPGDIAVKKALIGAIDADAAQLPEEFYKEARALAAERFRLVESVPELARLFDDPYAVSDEDMYRKLWAMPLRNWEITDTWIGRHGTPDSKAQWQATKKMMASQFYDDLLRKTSVQARSVGMDGGEDFAQLSAAKFGQFLDSMANNRKVRKLEALIGKQGVEELGMVRRYLQALEPPKSERSVVNPSGSGYKALEGVRNIADKWATSGNQGKIAVANSLNNMLNRIEQPFREGQQAATLRSARSELGRDVATESARRMRELKIRQEAQSAGEIRGFTGPEEYGTYAALRALSRGEEDRP